MKIVCDSCSTKYSISDDKVRGKVFKIRCKKCSHIIVVKGTAESAVAPEAPPDGVWHLVVDGDQVGPLTDADVRGRLSRNEISPENYVWKEGFADWLRLADVPEFADVAAVAASVGNDLFSDNNGIAAAPAAESPSLGAVSGGFFSAPAPSEPDHAATVVAPSTSFSAGLSASAAENAEAARVSEDAFSGPTSVPLGDGTDLFGMGAPSAARVDSGRVRGRPANGTAGGGRHDGGRVENLTAQRSENSVLFSLSNLQSLAAPPSSKASSSPTTEGSGLIDIRAMAASTMRSPGGGGTSMFGGDSKNAENDLPTFGAFSSAAPMLLSIPSSSGPPKWVYALLALGAVILILVGVAFFMILGRPVIVEQPAAIPAVAAPVPPPRAGAVDDRVAPALLKPLAEGDLPPRAGSEAAGDRGDARSAADKAAASKGASKKSKTVKKPGAPGGDARAAGAGAVAATPSASADPEKAKPAKGSLDDLLEGALNGRKSGRPKVDDDAPSRKGAAEPAASAGPLAKAAVVAGMNGVKSKVSACYAQYKQPGIVMVDVVIAKTGKISNASVSGKFAGTPTGSCVEAAVKTATFPPSEGLKTPYPFTLR